MSIKGRTDSELGLKLPLKGMSIFVASSILTAAGAFSAQAALTAGNKLLLGHVPNAVKRMSDVGKMEEQQVLPVTIALQLNNEAELDARISEIYQNGSSRFHQFLTPTEFNARYAPTDEQVAHEKAFLEANGISVQSLSSNRVLMHAQGTVTSLNQLFKTELHQYRRANGKISFAPAYDLQVPSGSKISAVIGMNNVATFHNHVRVNKNVNSKDGPQGTAPQGGLAPADLVQAYNIPASADGTGQTLALFELDGYDPTDIAAYEQQCNLPQVPLQNVLVDGYDGSAGQGAVEVVLDIEMMAALAPKATQILVYEGPNSSAGVIDTYAKIASDNLAKQISSSWGQAEDQAAAADMKAENAVFKQMVAQGQALFSASGDSGADDDGSALSVDDPSGQPYVIAVGGTTLTIAASDSSFVSETTWNELSNSEGAGGGGISKIWTLPSWQKNAFNADAQGSKTMRNVPDVSLNADPVTGYGIYQGGQWQTVGGTSAAAPLWAAFNALVNQQRAANSLASIGFPAVALYKIGEGKNYSSSFNDITVGTNGTGTDSFAAGKGFDNATGWGSFKGVGLLQQLSQDSSDDNSCRM